MLKAEFGTKSGDSVQKEKMWNHNHCLRTVVTKIKHYRRFAKNTEDLSNSDNEATALTFIVGSFKADFGTKGGDSASKQTVEP